MSPSYPLPLYFYLPLYYLYPLRYPYLYPYYYLLNYLYSRYLIPLSTYCKPRDVRITSLLSAFLPSTLYRVGGSSISLAPSIPY